MSTVSVDTEIMAAKKSPLTPSERAEVARLSRTSKLGGRTDQHRTQELFDKDPEGYSEVQRASARQAVQDEKDRWR